MGNSKSIASRCQHIAHLRVADLARLDPDFTNVGHHQTEKQSTHFTFSTAPTDRSHRIPARLFAKTDRNVDNTICELTLLLKYSPFVHDALRPRNDRRSIADFFLVHGLSTLVPIHNCGWIADGKCVLWFRVLATALAPNDAC